MKCRNCGSVWAIARFEVGKIINRCSGCFLETETNTRPRALLRWMPGRLSPRISFYWQHD